MNDSLLTIRANIFYTKENEGDQYEKHFEIVMLTDAAAYSRSNAGEIIRERKVKEQRFTCDADQLKKLGAAMIKMADSNEGDYK